MNIIEEQARLDSERKSFFDVCMEKLVGVLNVFLFLYVITIGYKALIATKTLTTEIYKYTGHKYVEMVKYNALHEMNDEKK